MADKAPVDPTVELVERAVAQLGDVIAAITPDQAALPTPCQDWDVRALLNHVVGRGLPNFVISARGGMVDWAAPHEEIGANWSEEFRAGAQSLLEAWRVADLDQLVPGPGGEAPLRGRADQQIAELVTHAWDLTRATGQSRTLDPELAEHTLAWSKRLLKPEYRGPGKAFGDEVPVAADAPVYDRLAAWFGRDPGWTPPERG